jgi:membrane protein DedA with SNARE-associated domain
MLYDLYQTIASALESHPYILLFVGLLFAGETILLPAIYFALSGRLSLSYVVAIAMAATTISDIVWYYIGLHMKERFFSRLINKRLVSTFEKLSGAFARRGALILYSSKFVYGTRVAAQLLSGAERMRFRTYVSVNFLGILSLTLFIVLLAYLTEASVERIGDLVHDLEVAFLAFVALLVLAHVAAGKYLKKLWYRQ